MCNTRVTHICLSHSGPSFMCNISDKLSNNGSLSMCNAFKNNRTKFCSELE